eukprot:gene13224-13331_t
MLSSRIPAAITGPLTATSIGPRIGPLRAGRVWPLAALLLLGGCEAGTGTFPSLALRPAERAFALGGDAATAPTSGAAAIGQPDHRMLKQITALHDQAIHAGEAFAMRAAEADHLAHAARGTDVGSEAWAAATSAMAALDSARSNTAVFLGDLDAMRVQMAVTAAQSGTPDDAATYRELVQADDAVAALVAAQDTRIGALRREIEK